MKKNIIPKIIHYVWLGNHQMATYMVDYLNITKSILNGYTIMIWKDEDVASFYDNSTFVKDALKGNKYAFLSDYLRLFILFRYGGIYLDTDVCILKKIDCFLKQKLVLGNIVDCSIGTAFIASCPNNPELKKWINYMEKQYDKNKTFISNNHWLTHYFLDNYDDFILNGKKQVLSNGIVVYPKTYFESAKPFYILRGGYSIHLCAGSWIDKKSDKSDSDNVSIKSVRQKHKSHLKILIKRVYYSSFLFKQKQRIDNYRLHISENKKYPFYSVYIKHKKQK